jgi:hypothetical protein
LRPIIQTAVLAVLLFTLTSCGSSSSTSTSLGSIFVNGPGITGTVPTGTTRLYTLTNIGANQYYTVRTAIATLGTSTTPDGTLTVSIYTSEDAFKNDPANPMAVLLPDANFPYIYEAYFQATTSGNYVAAISGASQSVPDTQFFYDLRVMSASYLTPFGNVGVNADNLNVFSGPSVTQSGSYLIHLVASSVTVTTAYPQMFIYGDQSLKIISLRYSCVASSADFVVTDFTANPAGNPVQSDPNNNLKSGVTITAQFSVGTPFIVVRGTSAVSYSLTVGPAP